MATMYGGHTKTYVRCWWSASRFLVKVVTLSVQLSTAHKLSLLGLAIFGFGYCVVCWDLMLGLYWIFWISVSLGEAQ